MFKPGFKSIWGEFFKGDNVHIEYNPQEEKEWDEDNLFISGTIIAFNSNFSSLFIKPTSLNSSDIEIKFIDIISISSTK